MQLPNAVSNTDMVNKLWRATRAAMGAFILIVIVTSILIPQVLSVTGNSLVNAKLEWIRTPINGNVAYNNILPGNIVVKGDILGEITNPRADDNFLNSLQFEKSSIDSDLFTLANKHQQLQQKKWELAVGVTDALKQLKDQTEIRINTKTTELKLADGKKSELEFQIKRYIKANKEFSSSQPYSIVSRDIIDEQRFLLAEVSASISNQKDALKILKADFESAQNGTFTGKNTPQEQQKLTQIEQNIAAVFTEQEALKFRLSEISNDIDERTEKLNLNKKHEFTSRVNGIVWDLGYADGSYVNNGDSLIAVADSDTLTVECIFHQRYLDNIEYGDYASVDLMGSNEKLTGRVSKITIRDSENNSDLRAFTSNIPQTNEFKVTVTLDANQTHTPKIGQRAKVVITKDKTSLVAGLLLFMSR